MSEYLVIEETSYKQDAWVEEVDAKSRIVKPVRPARNEKVITVRLDRQCTAKLRLGSAKAAGAGRQGNIAAAVKAVGLGGEVAPGIQVVEYEARLSEAREAMVTPEEKDEAGNLVREESFTPAIPERVEHVFTCRLNGMHLAKMSLTDAEFRQPNWRDTLAAKVPSFTLFMR